MKRIFILFVALLSVVGCGSISENKPNVANVNSSAVEKPKPEIVKETNTEPEVAKAEAVDKETVTKFENTKLPDGWELIDETQSGEKTEYEITDGSLKLIIPSGKDLYGENRTAPRLLKSVSGNFQIETRVIFAPKNSYQGAGLIIQNGRDNFIRFERAFGGKGGGESGIRLDVMKDKDYSSIATPTDIPTDVGSVDLRIIRDDDLFIAFWRTDQESEWKEAGEFKSDYPDSVKVGLIGVNTAEKIIAEFSYIRLLPGKIE